MSRDRVPVHWICPAEHTEEPPRRGAWTLVEVMSVWDPSRFCVCFPFGARKVQKVVDQEALRAIPEEEEGEGALLLHFKLEKVLC